MAYLSNTSHCKEFPQDMWIPGAVGSGDTAIYTICTHTPTATETLPVYLITYTAVQI